MSMAKKDLLSLNFEGILKYFRVQLPKRYRNEMAARQLMKLTSSFKLKKLKKYEKEWLAIKVSYHFVKLEELILKIYTVWGFEMVFHKLIEEN